MMNAQGEIVTTKEFTPPSHLKGLFQYLQDNDKFADIKNYDQNLLKINTDAVLKLIQSGETGWEELVPKVVSKLIKDNCLFGYPCEVTSA